MAFPELLANTPTPGTAAALTTLGAAISSTSSTTMTTVAAAPTTLQATGQFRVIIDSEIILVTGGAATTTWTIARGQEGSTAATHLNGANISHVWTTASMQGQFGQSTWTPAVNGLLLATGDPAAFSIGLPLINAFVAILVPVPVPMTVTNYWTVIDTGGSGLTAGQSQGLIYSSSGTLIAQTADQSASWTSAGAKGPLALTAASGQSLTLAGGNGAMVYLAFCSPGTTPPRMIGQAVGNYSQGNSSLGPNSGGSHPRIGYNAATSVPGSLPTLTVSYKIPLIAIS